MIKLIKTTCKEAKDICKENNSFNIIKKIPKDEKIVLSYYTDGSIKFIITTKKNDSSWYYRYDVIDSELKKYKKKEKSPLDLESV